VGTEIRKKCLQTKNGQDSWLPPRQSPGEARKVPPVEPRMKVGPWLHLDFELLAPRMVKE
jgi:hypothetical protein